LLDFGIVRRVGEYEHMGEIFCRRAEHGGAADIDKLHRVLQRKPRLDLFKEGVKVYTDQVDGPESQLFQGFHVFCQVPPGKEARVNCRMQGLYPAVQTFGEARYGRNVGDGEPLFLEVSGGSAGGKEFPVLLDEKSGQFLYARFIKNTE
jgi:hypothetical protein